MRRHVIAFLLAVNAALVVVAGFDVGDTPGHIAQCGLAAAGSDSTRIFRPGRCELRNESHRLCSKSGAAPVFAQSSPATREGSGRRSATSGSLVQHPPARNLCGLREPVASLPPWTARAVASASMRAVGEWTVKDIKDRDVTFVRGADTRVIHLAPSTGQQRTQAAAAGGQPGAATQAPVASDPRAAMRRSLEQGRAELTERLNRGRAR